MTSVNPLHDTHIRIGRTDKRVIVTIPEGHPLYAKRGDGEGKAYIEMKEEGVWLYFNHPKGRAGYKKLRNGKADNGHDWQVEILARYVPGAERQVSFRAGICETIDVDGDTALIAYPAKLLPPIHRNRPKGIGEGEKRTKRRPAYQPGTPRERVQETSEVSPPVDTLPSEAPQPYRQAIGAAALLNDYVREGSLRVRLDTDGCVVLFRLVEQELKA